MSERAAFAMRAVAVVQYYRRALVRWDRAMLSPEQERHAVLTPATEELIASVRKDIIPRDCIGFARSMVAASLAPGEAALVEEAVHGLRDMKTGDVADRDAYAKGMAAELEAFPIDIVRMAVWEARHTEETLPSVKTMIAICERLVRERRALLDPLAAMEAEHERRRRAAA